MTTEEKARAYDEVVNKIKPLYEQAIKDDNPIWSTYEYLIPSFCESEDERIRKSLIGLVEQFMTDGRKEKTLAWLEKMKEYPTNEETLRTLRAEYEKGVADTIAKYEQKPILKHERIFPKFAIGDTVCRPMWSDHTIREIYVNCDDPTYICVNEEGVESHIPFSEQDEWKKKEQKLVPKFKVGDTIKKKGKEYTFTIAKIRDEFYLGEGWAFLPFDQQDKWELVEQKSAEWSEKHIADVFEKVGLAKIVREQGNDGLTNAVQSAMIELSKIRNTEWSEEDEKIRQSIIEDIEFTRNFTEATTGRVIGKYNEQINWLKFLPERFNIQSKQEWSDEEYGRLFDIEHYLDGTLQLSPDRRTACIDFIKSLRPQPHTVSIKDATKFGNLEYERGVKDGIQSEKSRQWKPDDEQIRPLEYAIEYFKKKGNDTTYLESLHEDLMKLI